MTDEPCNSHKDPQGCRLHCPLIEYATKNALCGRGVIDCDVGDEVTVTTAVTPKLLSPNDDCSHGAATFCV